MGTVWRNQVTGVSGTLVLGNGESRKGLDLAHIYPHYTIVGGNAVHRAMVVDHLVCCDRRMVLEATEGKNTKDTKIYVRGENYQYFRKVRKDKRINSVPYISPKDEQKHNQPINWGSGPYAVLVAATLESDNITLLGFDLYGNNDKVNNLYKGTNNYADADTHPIDPSYWKIQIGEVFKNHPHKNFTIKNMHEWDFPPIWQKPNVHFEQFYKSIS